MYIPPFAALLTSLNITKKVFETEGHVSIPTSLLRTLLSLALIHADFDEGSYLAAKPDIAAAATDGVVNHPRSHYIVTGYFEGREGAVPDVDEDWYTRTYLDVAEALRCKTIPSARHISRVWEQVSFGHLLNVMSWMPCSGGKRSESRDEGRTDRKIGA